MGESKIRNATKVTYDDIEFSSKLELFCYKQLKEAGIEFIYQPSSVILVETFEIDFPCYETIGKVFRDENKKVKYTTKRFDLTNPKVRGITYTPDFACVNNTWVIETKGAPNESFPLRWKLYKDKLRRDGYKGLLMMPSTQKEILECIKIIKEL